MPSKFTRVLVIAALVCRVIPSIIALAALRQVPKLDRWANTKHDHIRAHSLPIIERARVHLEELKDKEPCE